MPTTKRHPVTKTEIQELTLALNEMKARGIPVPETLKKQAKASFTTPNGYFTGKDGSIYHPTETHKNFIACPAHFVAMFGGRGSGKSAAGAQKSLAKVKLGLSGAVINADFQNMISSTWPELRKWIPWEMVVPQQMHRANSTWEPQKPFTMVFKNGATMLVKGLKDPDAARGPNINWLWYDEAGRDDTGLAWRLAIAGVRVGKDPQAWVTTTPKGKEHWLYKLFVEQDFTEEVLELFREIAGDQKLVEYFVASIEENKSNLDPGFYAATVAMYPPGWMKLRELDGMFVDEGGSLGNALWFAQKILPQAPVLVKARVRYWDLAASEKKIAVKGKRDDPDETVGTLMSWNGLEDFTVEDMKGGFWNWDQLLDQILFTAKIDGPAVKIFCEQEPGAGGKNQVAAISKHVNDAFLAKKIDFLPSILPHRPEGDKVMRAQCWFADAALGHVWLVYGPWNNKLISQVASFPQLRHDDYVDSVSGARVTLAPVKLWRRMEFLHV